MKPTNFLLGALAAVTAVAAQPAAAYPIKTTGRTLASPRLAADVLRQIGAYSKATGGCSMVFSAEMQVMPKRYVPRRPTVPAVARGGHFELWTVNVCAARQRFQVAMWPSPRGGSDFAVTPLTGRMPLHAR
ncbi:hypothetical protein [Sphingomonas sp. VNH70]|uniref:hypothetical protein n=1 Tax=Sphingomonas silueang TaxID=3156617 RepID=UPI0032B626B7